MKHFKDSHCRISNKWLAGRSQCRKFSHEDTWTCSGASIKPHTRTSSISIY